MIEYGNTACTGNPLQEFNALRVVYLFDFLVIFAKDLSLVLAWKY